jgi:hypothetical protein
VTPLQPALAAGFLMPWTLGHQPNNFFANNLQAIVTFPMAGLDIPARLATRFQPKLTI